VLEFEGVRLRRVREGVTEIFVPDPFFYKKGRTDYLPASLPVWYNPRMEINRDITLLVLDVYVKYFASDLDEIVYVEALGGTGIRGFRVSNELVGLLSLPIRVVLNDVNPPACRLMEFNRDRMGFGDVIDIFCFDANYLFHFLKKVKDYRLDVIELDPYGSPMPFVPSTAQVLRGKGGLGLISATDLAPLHGKFPRSGQRKYGAWLVRNKFEAEVATRALIYSVGREFSIYSKLFRPVFSLSYDGFIKIVGMVDKGKMKANSFWEKVVFLEYHVDDPYNSTFVSLDEIPARVVKGVKYIGPIWGGWLGDEYFCDLMLGELKNLPISMSSKRKIERFLRWLVGGYDLPLFVDLNDFSVYSGGYLPPIDSVVSYMKERGIRCSRTFFNFNAVKIELCEENLELLKGAIKSLSGASGG